MNTENARVAMCLLAQREVGSSLYWWGGDGISGRKELGRDSSVLCIAAGGGRVLDLLVRKPREIWAVDVNPCQCHLLSVERRHRELHGGEHRSGGKAVPDP